MYIIVCARWTRGYGDRELLTLKHVTVDGLNQLLQYTRENNDMTKYEPIQVVFIREEEDDGK